MPGPLDRFPARARAPEWRRERETHKLVDTPAPDDTKSAGNGDGRLDFI
jgi:hypothetical protein